MAKTRQQIADELGVSVTTLWRRLKKADFNIRPGLIYPADELEILRFLGVIPPEPKGEMGD